MRSKVEKYFRRYLRIGPLALALWRATEAKHFGNVSMKRPILDIGCGFGEFAESFVEREPIDMGVDIAARDLLVAAKGGKYKNLLLADASDLPLQEDSFGTVMSVSTLEDIEKADKALKEAFRVLKPGGLLVVSIETEIVDTKTFYRPFLAKMGFKGLSDSVSKAYNTLFHRLHLLPSKEWEKKIEKAGFEIVVAKDIISPRITKLFDIFLITAWPSQVFRVLFGKRMVFRPKFVEDILVKIFLKYVKEPDKNGTNIFIVAKKPRKQSKN